VASAGELLIRIMGDPRNAVQAFIGLRQESQSSMRSVTAAVQGATTQLSRNASGVRQALGTMFDDVTADRLIDELRQSGRAGESASREIIQALNRIQGETDRTATGLNIFGEAWREVGQDARRSLNDTQDELRDTDSMLDKVKKGVAALAAGFAGLKIAESVDDAASSAGHLRAMLGKTKEETEEFNNIAREVYGDNFGESMREASETVAMVNQSLGLTGEELKKQTETVLMLNDVYEVYGADTQADLQAVRSMMTAWRIDSQYALDIITKGFQDGAGAAGDFLDTMTEYPKFFKDIGLNAQDMSKWLTEGMRAGAMDTDKLADSVHEMARIFKEETDRANEALVQMFPAAQAEKLMADIAVGGEKGREAFYTIAEGLANIKDPAQRAALSVELFGDVAGELSLNVLDPLLKKFVELKDTQLDTAGATDSMNAEYTGLSATIEGLKKKFETSLFGTVLDDAVMPLVDGLGSVGLAMIGLGPIVTKLSLLWTKYEIATKLAAAAQWALNAAMDANLIGVIILAIAALVAGGIALYQNWDTVKAKVSELGQAVKTVFNNIRSSVSGLWEEAVTWGSNIIQGMVNGITSKLQSAKEAALSVASSVKDAITGFFDMRSPSKVTEELGKYVAEGLAKGIEKGTSEAEQAAEKMAQAVQGAVSLVLGDIDKTFQLASAGLEVKNMLSSNNITEIQRLKNELQKLQLELQQATEKVDALNDIYEMTKAKLGENSEVTKQYEYDLKMAKIALEKLNIEIANNAVAQEQASIDQIIRRQKELFDQYSKALKAESEEIKKAYEERKELIEAEIEADEELIKSKEELIDKLKEETDSRVKALQAQIEALEEEADTESRAEAEEEYNATIAELTEERNKEALYAGKEHKEKVEELDKQIAEAQKEWQEKQNEWAREDQEKALQDQIDAIEEEADIREDAIKDEIDDIKAANEKKRKELEKYYSEVQELISDSTLEMLAKLAMTNDQWYQQGVDWMHQLAQGMVAGSTELPLGASEFFGGVQAQGSSGGAGSGTSQLIASIGPGQYINANGTTYMASRDLAGMLDQPVEWDQVNQRVKIGTQWFTPWKVEDGTSYVGIREVAEALGYTVGWDDSNVKIYKAAKGGIFHSPAITQIAEAGGSEVAAPLSTLLPMMRDTLIDALMSIGPKFSSMTPSPAMAGGGDTIINLTFPGPITIRSDDDIVQISDRLGGLVRSTQRGVGRR